MAHAGSIVGQTTAHLLRTRINHRKLVATIFPRAASEEMTDAAGVDIEDQVEMFHSAASQGMLSSVLALVADRRFSFDRSDRFGRSPLHWAAEQGHGDVVLALIRAGASVDLRSQRKATPIMLAASTGHADVVGVLLQYHAGGSDCWPLNHHRHGIENWRSTALHCAAAGGHVRVVENLLDAGFHRGQHDGAGLTPAEVSARQSHTTSPAITHLLLPTSDMGGKLVHDYVNMAIQDVAMVSGLVKGGASLDWQDGNGETPLHRAVHFHHVMVTRVLLQGGADPNLRDHRGASPLHTAACTGCVEVAADLLRAGADLEQQTVGGHSPLHRAVMNNKVNVCSLLLNEAASTEHRDDIHGQTPLSWACKGFLAPIVRVLVKAGADVESRSSAGLTPLHWACRFVDAESVEALLNAGADPGAVDQAAADAVATSSSGRGTIVSMPVAIDVIGLGYPLEENSRCPCTGGSLTLAARRLDLASIKRIELALQGAKQERSWRRRGWLVILANRCVAMGAPGVGDNRWTGCCGSCRAIIPSTIASRCFDTIVERSPCAHQKGAASYRIDANTNSGSSDSQCPQYGLSSGPDVVGKKPRTVRSVGMITRSASRRQGQTRGDNGAQANMTVSLPELVDALLGLTAVEVGLFRNVVMFI